MPNLAHDLFLLMSNLSHLKNRERMITVFVEAMSSFIPGVAVEYIDSDESREIEDTVEICTAKKQYGMIRILSDLQQLPNEFMVLFQNAVQVLAVFLEKLEQDKLLADEKLMLKELVDQRTRELQTSEEQFRFLVNSSPIGICVHRDNKILFANPVLQTICAAPSIEHLANTRVMDWLLPEYHDDARQRLDELINKRKATSPINVKIRRLDGTIIDCRTQSIPIMYLNAPAGYTTIEDISELKRLQKLEARAQRLETAGSIAGQVAHDFNNLLGPLVAYPEFIRDELSLNHPALEYLDSIETAATRISEINQQLLTLGRRGHYNLEPMDFNAVIRQVVAEYPLSDPTFVIDTILEDALLPIRGGVSQLYRVILNLVQNAFDAANGIGTVTITSENHYVDDEIISSGKVPRGEYVKITVTDTGCGISKDVLNQIFDPFFSTKSSNRRHGSGLGLSIVDAVVRDHNGYVDVSSNIGQGTTFYLLFPISRDGSGETEKEDTAGSGESILVIDDDALQRDVLCRILKKLGYTVDTVSSGEAAIEFLRHSPRDLLILDMIMKPGIDGVETYRRISDIAPGQKAILVSGYSETERVVEAQRLGAGEFVKKPVSKQVIASAVRRELDREKRIITGH